MYAFYMHQRLAGENGEKIVHEEILTNPLTPDLVIDLEALKAKRQELLAEAKKTRKAQLGDPQGQCCHQPRVRASPHLSAEHGGSLPESGSTQGPDGDAS